MLEKLGNIGKKFIDILIVLVFIEAILTTYPWMNDHFEDYFEGFVKISSSIFVVEILIRIAFGGKNFWVGKDWAWNWFDLIITVVTTITSTGYFATFRTLRLLRLLRLLRVFTIFEGLRVIVGSLIRSIPKVGWLVALWGSIMVIYAVIGCHIFREDFPELFGDFSGSCFTMFQLMTLDGWGSDISRTIMEKYPWSWIYFVSYICITAFILLNALTGVMCSSMAIEDTDENDRTDEKLDLLLAKIDALQKEVEELKDEKINS